MAIAEGIELLEQGQGAARSGGCGMRTFFTAGYQGQTIDLFLEQLRAHGVEHVIDIRERPQSRKPDFGRRRLIGHLAEVGIGYTHLVELGTPKPLRDGVRKSHDYPAFFAAMEPVIAAQPAALDAALDLIAHQSCALLCFEADYRECHRLTVAEALVRRAPGELAVVHLTDASGGH
jgi:uncharacterized protein (DUF488 family)